MVGVNEGPPGDHHAVFPILKLGDLGLAMQMTPLVMKSRYNTPPPPMIPSRMLTRCHNAGSLSGERGPGQRPTISRR